LVSFQWHSSGIVPVALKCASVSKLGCVFITAVPFIKLFALLL